MSKDEARRILQQVLDNLQLKAQERRVLDTALAILAEIPKLEVVKEPK